MKKEIVSKLFIDFSNNYNSEESLATWKRQSDFFRKFWNDKILDDNYKLSIPEDLNPIISILDETAAKGFKGSDRYEAIAYTNIFKPTWYEIFKKIKNDEDKKKLLDEIFNAREDPKLIGLLDQLFEINKNHRIKALTGHNAIVINALLFAYNPEDNISVISLNDRYKIIDFFKLGDSTQIASQSYGNRVVKSRDPVISFREKFHLDIDNRGLSNFFYYEPLKKIWKDRENKYFVDDKIYLLQSKKQIILYGPPGTGKTFSTRKYCIEIIESD